MFANRHFPNHFCNLISVYGLYLDPRDHNRLARSYICNSPYMFPPVHSIHWHVSSHSNLLQSRETWHPAGCYTAILPLEVALLLESLRCELEYRLPSNWIQEEKHRDWGSCLKRGPLLHNTIHQNVSTVNECKSYCINKRWGTPAEYTNKEYEYCISKYLCAVKGYLGRMRNWPA